MPIAPINTHAVTPPSQDKRQKLLVIGNGMAGIRVLETLLESTQAAQYQITVIGEEPHTNYNRIMLSPVLAQESAFDEIVLNSPEWYQHHQIRLHTGDPVVQIDRQRKVAISFSGLTLPYDLLVLATGSRSAALGVSGEHLKGVTGFRTKSDVDQMLRYVEKRTTHTAAPVANAVVVGGGLLGLEAAAGLAKHGLKTTLLHRSPWLLNRQLDPKAAALLQQALEQRGIRFLLSHQVRCIEGQNHVRQVQLSSGESLSCDLLVAAAGITPEIRLAQQAGLHCERGIVVNDQLQSSDPYIFAVGECSQFQGHCYGLVAPAWAQAEVLGQYLAGKTQVRFQHIETATRLKVSGINLFSAGEINPPADAEVACLITEDIRLNHYRKLVLRNNRLVGILLYGDVSDGNWFFRLLQAGKDLSPIRNTLIFGEAINQALSQQHQLTQITPSVASAPNTNTQAA